MALITQPLPTASVTLIGLSVAMITKTMPLSGTPAPALAGFSNTTVWLIVAAFFISEGFLLTGLGRRIALGFVRVLGRSSLGLAYGMAATDLVLAPATPSNTARAGGVIYPIVRSLAELEVYAVFLSRAIATGAPLLFAALALGYIGNLVGALTHYSSGPSAVIAGSGYVKIAEWFRIAFIMSIPVILIWTVVGGAWMSVLGLWD